MDDGFTDSAVLSAAERLGDGGMWLVDGQHSTWSAGMRDLHGLDAGAPAPGIDGLAMHVHAGDRQAVLAALGPGPSPPVDPVEVGYRLSPDRGGPRDLLLRGDWLSRPSGRAWLAVVQDVGPRRAAERAMRVHYALHRSLSHWEAGTGDKTDLLRRLATALELPLAALWIVDEAAGRLVARAVWREEGFDDAGFGELTLKSSFARGQGIPGRVWATGEPVVAAEVTRVESARRKAAHTMALRCGLAFPTTVGTEPSGVVGLYGTDAWTPDSDLMDTLRGLGGHLGRFLAVRAAELGRPGLSPREGEVLQLAATGLTTERIAGELGLEASTIKTHFERIFRKLGVTDRSAAVAKALRTGLMR